MLCYLSLQLSFAKGSLMSYPKYFKPGQKIQLRPLAPAPAPGRVELLTSYLEDQGTDSFRLKLPYGDKASEQYPFEDGMTLELSSESMGIGLKITGNVTGQPTPGKLALQLNHDLQAYQRRDQPRLDTQVELRLSRGQENLRSMREAWHKNVDLLERCTDFSSLGKFRKTEVNLSLGGIRFAFKPPVSAADLCLLLIRLPEKQRPICALAEVMWTAKIPPDSPLAGMQFIQITESDQDELARFVRQSLKS